MNGTNIYRKQPQPDEEPIDLLAQVGTKPQTLVDRANLSKDVQAAIDEIRRQAGIDGQDQVPEAVEFRKYAGLMPPFERPSRDEFFFRMAELASTMATCPRAQCGAVIVRHKRPLSIGYNGAPDNMPHCPSEGEALAEHLRVEHCGIATHAEVNAIKNAVGNVYGATIYVYGHRGVCFICAAELSRVGITDIRHRPGPHHGIVS